MLTEICTFGCIYIYACCFIYYRADTQRHGFQPAADEIKHITVTFDERVCQYKFVLYDYKVSYKGWFLPKLPEALSNVFCATESNRYVSRIASKAGWLVSLWCVIS